MEDSHALLSHSGLNHYSLYLREEKTHVHIIVRHRTQQSEECIGQGVVVGGLGNG